MISAAVTGVRGRDDPVACCAGLALVERGAERVAVVVADAARPRSALLAATAARDLEDAVSAAAMEGVEVASRGHLCVASAASDGAAIELVELLGSEGASVVVSTDPANLEHWQRRLTLVRGELPADRELLALLADSLGPSDGLLRVDKRGPGRIGARRALAGLPPGRGPSARYRWLCRGI